MSNTKEVQEWTVASGIIVEQQQLLLVQNQRRNGSLDWSTPGGVVDPGEEVLEALQREVIEETSVVAEGWSPMVYSVDVEFVGRDMTLNAQVFRAAGYSGTLHVDDPDNIVVDGRWVSAGEAHTLLESSPRWVAEPLRHYVGQWFNDQSPTAPGGLVAGAPNRMVAPRVAQVSELRSDLSAQPPGRWEYRVTGRGSDSRAELVDFAE